MITLMTTPTPQLLGDGFEAEAEEEEAEKEEGEQGEKALLPLLPPPLLLLPPPLPLLDSAAAVAAAAAALDLSLQLSSIGRAVSRALHPGG